MLAIRATMDRSLCPPATGVGDRSLPGHGGGWDDAGVEGVIYYTPDGDGYVLYAAPRPGDAAATAHGPSRSRR
jgi:hypothetical protein